MVRLTTIWTAILLLFCQNALCQSCSNATTTIRNAADASSLIPCATFTGTVVIATDFPDPVIEVDGPETVVGSIYVANNSQITTIASRDLTTITEDCVLENLPLLANITLPKWTSVTTLTLSKIPTPNTLNMQTTFQQVSNLYVTNTTLEALPGLLLQSAQMDVLSITGNKYLENGWFGVGNITQQATILNNGGQMSLTMPNLTYAYNMNISNASTVNIPLLQSVSQNLDISWNSVQNISLPKLSYVGAELSLTNNVQLTALAFEQLVNIQGNFIVSNNPLLNQVAGLEALSYVGGDLTLDGNINNISLPSLRSIAGSFNLQSSNTDVSCSSVPSSIVKGLYQCDGKNPSPSSTRSAAIESSTSSSTPSKSPTHKSGLTNGAIAGIVVGVIAAAVVAAVIFTLWFRRRSRPQQISPYPTQQSDYDYDGHREKSPAPPLPVKSHKRESLQTYGYEYAPAKEMSISRQSSIRTPVSPIVPVTNLERMSSIRSSNGMAANF
ncbi:hypothetical protein M433DRAFT_140419 [Acidomyces richmondensis BFW]|nr:MAG: hypothetical protein FE78DRAFT_83635 [Acidomyces sp. 'richmondensis']KYG49061.1 hypothetical protein M433DRAFT_140419 [Acidomyces richmondensis BFW]